MSQRLEQLHDDIQAQLGQYAGDNPPSTRAMDDAIHLALIALQGMLPPLEATVTLTVTGQEQDLAALLPDLHLAYWVVFPWFDSLSDRQQGYPFTFISRTNVRITYCCPHARQQLLVCSRPRCTLAGLDSTTERTMAQGDERASKLSAAGELLKLYALKLFAEDSKDNGPR